MNRAAKRRAAKAGHVHPGFDPDSVVRIDYKFFIPPGLVRDKHPQMFAGVVEAELEADALRGIVVKLLEALAYDQSVPAVAGLLAEMVNAFPDVLRMRLARGIIEGTGFLITEESPELCVFCSAQKETHEEIDSEDPDVVTTVDDTAHTEHHVHPDPEEEICTAECRGPHDAVYAPERRIAIYSPHRFKPLVTEQQEATEDAGTDAVPATRGYSPDEIAAIESAATGDADNSGEHSTGRDGSDEEC